jgi:hypothetical protein
VGPGACRQPDTMSPETPLEITGQLDAGSHEGRLQEVALEFMEYMCYAYKV